MPFSYLASYESFSYLRHAADSQLCESCCRLTFESHAPFSFVRACRVCPVLLASYASSTPSSTPSSYACLFSGVLLLRRPIWAAKSPRFLGAGCAFYWCYRFWYSLHSSPVEVFSHRRMADTFRMFTGFHSPRMMNDFGDAMRSSALMLIQVRG